MIKKTAICLGGPDCAKRAALYFDHVLHIFIGLDCARRHPFWPDEIRNDHAAAAHFGLMTHSHVMAGSSTDDVHDRFRIIETDDPGNHTDTPVLFPMSDGATQNHLEYNYQNNVGGVLGQLDDFLRRYKVENTVFVADSDGAFTGSDATPDPAVVLSGLPVVDTSNAKWEQVQLVRDDADSVRAFRHLGVFMHDNLSGKSKDYIQDRLMTEVDDYEAACKKHGFELLTGSLTTVFSHESAFAASAATAAAVILGAPLVVAAATGPVVLASKLVLKLVKGRHDLGETRRKHPISYIIRARDALEDS